MDAGKRPVIPDITMEQPISPKDERIVSANPSLDAAVTEPSIDAPEPKGSAAGGSAIPCKFTPYVPLTRKTSYTNYGNNAVIWDGYPLTPVMYGDNPSMMYHSGFGFNSEMLYGQYSPFSAPFPSVMVDGQFYSAQQMSFSPAYYPQSAPPNMPPGFSYLVPFGSFGEVNVSGNPVSGSLPSPISYPHQPMGILGSYKQSVGQRQVQGGFGLPPNSGTGRYANGGSSYQSSNSGNASSFPYKGRRRDAISDSSESYAADYSRGPRAFKSKGKTVVDSGKSFAIDYDKAKFFIIKSFNEDNMHKSVKYNVWASTPNGNQKLDEAYAQSKETTEKCPVFLFFSVNGSGQFCGLAEMTGPVDFEKDADHWHQDKWRGQFPVRWHMIKDVPNTLFRHIILENNENKPVTHSRDSQEVNFEIGIEMLRIFKDHDARTSIIDDFDFYNERENRMLMERKSAKPPVSQFTDDSSKVIQLDDEVEKKIPLSETDGGSSVEGSVSIADDDTFNQIAEEFSKSLVLEGNGDDKQVPYFRVTAMDPLL